MQFRNHSLRVFVAWVMSIVILLGTISAIFIDLSATSASASIPSDQIPPQFAGISHSRYVSDLYICDRAGQIGDFWFYNTYEVSNVELYSFRECADYLFETQDTNMSGKMAYALDFIQRHDLLWLQSMQMDDFLNYFFAYIWAYAKAGNFITSPVYCITVAQANPFATEAIATACEYVQGYWELVHGG